MLKIGEFSKLSRISVRMLRHYDEIGLLSAGYIDPFTGYRYYQESQLPAAGRILFLRDMGFGLETIGVMLEHWDDCAAVERQLCAREAEELAALRQAERRLRLLRTARERINKEDDTMKYSVVLKTLPERYAACVRSVIPCYEREGDLWHTLLHETDGLGMQDGEPCYCCAVFHDQEHKEADVDVEVQKTVKGRYPDTEHVRFRTLPPVTVASATYQGSYEHMGEANAAVASWVRDNGYDYDGPAFNIYHVSPHETCDPEKFVTEVCYPVRKM